MAIIACIYTRVELSVHLQLANTIASKSGRGSWSERCSGRRCFTSRFLNFASNPGQTQIIFNPGLTLMTRTKCDPVDPDDPTQFNAEKHLCDLYESRWIHNAPTPNRDLYAVVKKGWGAQRVMKVVPWCKHCSCYSWWKGTSKDEATLISEEIKFGALTILELCLPESINK